MEVEENIKRKDDDVFLCIVHIIMYGRVGRYGKRRKNFKKKGGPYNILIVSLMFCNSKIMCNNKLIILIQVQFLRDLKRECTIQ